MDQKDTGTNVMADETTQEVQKSRVTEHREVYGTAKTENLRDWGLWRILGPGAVITFCVTLFIVPLLILIPLLMNSIDGLMHGNAAEAQLLWVWITMIVLELAVAAIVAIGMIRALTTQAGNYPRVQM